MTTRRNVLTILGFAGASPAAAALPTADDIADTEHKTYRMSRYNAERFAVALENLAKEIRAETIGVERFHVETEVGGESYDKFLVHRLRIDLAILMDEKLDGTPIG